MITNTDNKIARRHSKKRDEIRQALEGRTDHPTAEVIYQELRAFDPNISLGTVYRNLMLLSESGEIKTLNVADGSIHFDPDVSSHAHFRCECCGKVFDIKTNDLQRLSQPLGFKGKIKGISLIFYGVCEDCLNSSKKDH